MAAGEAIRLAGRRVWQRLRGGQVGGVEAAVGVPHPQLGRLVVVVVVVVVAVVVMGAEVVRLQEAAGVVQRQRGRRSMQLLVQLMWQSQGMTHRRQQIRQLVQVSLHRRRSLHTDTSGSCQPSWCQNRSSVLAAHKVPQRSLWQ